MQYLPVPYYQNIREFWGSSVDFNVYILLIVRFVSFEHKLWITPNSNVFFCSPGTGVIFFSTVTGYIIINCVTTSLFIFIYLYYLLP